MKEFNINRILVPVDFGAGSINALNTAVSLAKQHDATILLLNVVEMDIPASRLATDEVPEDMMDAIIQQSETELLSLQNSVSERFLVPCEALCQRGEVASSIIAISVSEQADMIIMGTSGMSGMKQFLKGTAVYNVVRNADCPVLTIPPDKKWDSFRKILFPIRPIPAALEKYDFVRMLLNNNRASLKILGMANDYDRDVDFLKELALQLNEKLKEDKVEASTYFKVGGNMAEEVLKIGSLMEADLVVITATVESSFKEFFNGPYTRHIINHSHFPVLSIRPSAEIENREKVMLPAEKSFIRETILYN